MLGYYYIIILYYYIIIYYILYSSLLQIYSSHTLLFHPSPPSLSSSFILYLSILIYYYLYSNHLFFPLIFNIPPHLLIHSILVDTYICLLIFQTHLINLPSRFWGNTVEYLTITPKHQFSSDLDEIQSNTLQSLFSIPILPNPLLLFTPPSPPSFILYLSILIYVYLYSFLINKLTPHILSEACLEWCSFICVVFGVLGVCFMF